jgi:hypothetical protein
MPFKSKAQAALMYATNKKLANEMSKKTSKAAWKKMPDKVKKKK